jgi:hypothetical protein
MFTPLLCIDSNLLTKFDPATSPFNLPPAQNINALVSAQTDAVIARATKAVLVERFQSVRELRQALYSTSRPGVNVPTPILALNLAALSVDLANAHFSNQDTFWVGELKIQNTGAGVLQAQLNSPETWLTVQPASVTCSAGAQTTVQFFVQRGQLPDVDHLLARVKIISNGGSFDFPVAVQGFRAPLLDVSERVLKFSKANAAQIRWFEIRNRGGRVLQGTLTTERSWLILVPTSFQGDATRVTVTLDSYLLPQTASDIRGEVLVSSNGGVQIVQVIVEH